MAFHPPERDNNLYVKPEHDDIILLSIPLNKFNYISNDIILGKINDDQFISFTRTKNELSLFISKSLLTEDELRIFNVTKDEPLYSSFRFYNVNPGIYHVGIVNKISNLFLGINMPIIYVNSYGNNYILIKSRLKELAIMRIIEENNFVLIED